MHVLINTYKIMKKEDRFKAIYLFFLIILNVFLENAFGPVGGM